MASKMIHLNNSTPGLAPAAHELVAGQIAINTADKLIFILGSDNNVYTFYAGKQGTVTSVNGKNPVAGAVTLVPSDLGATSTGTAVFTASTAATAVTALGATTVGAAVFSAASQSSAQTALGATTVGSALFTASTTTAAMTAMGGSAVGQSVFTAASTGAAQTAIGASGTGSSIFTAANASAVVTLLSVIPTSQIGAASGVAPLDVNSKVPTANLPASVLGSVNYQGTFTPGTSTLPAAASGNKGWYYITTAAGTYTPPSGSLLTFLQGDWLISNGTEWDVVDAQDAVTSVNGHLGAVVLAATDITTGTFAAAQLGSGSAASEVLTTNGSGVPTWVAAVPVGNLGASAAANAVLTTNGSSVPTWATTVPTSNLPVATAAALGLAEAGTGLSVAAGVFSVNTSVLTMDEGTYTGT